MRLLLVCLASLLVFACQDSVINSRQAAQHFIFCSENSPRYFNPQLDTSATTADASAQQIYDRLLDIDLQSGQLIPGLATAWQVLDDGLTYRFTLRRDVAFHQTNYFQPSRFFNAEDVVFSFQRWAQPQHPYHSVNHSQYPYFTSLQLPQQITGIKALNTHQVEITLNKANASFLAHLATDYANILSAEYAQQLLVANRPAEIDILPIGTGPFKFVSYQTHKLIRFAKHDDYWQTPAQIEQLIFDITPNPTIRFSKFISQECDSMTFPSHSELRFSHRREGINIIEETSLNTAYWAFNTHRSPFNKRRVRQALSMAIDRNTIVDSVYQNSAQRARNILPPHSWAYTANVNDVSFNPKLAQQILAEEGLDNLQMTIWVSDLARAYNPRPLQMAEIIRQYLSQIGVQAKVVKLTWERLQQGLQIGEYDSVILGWSGDNNDPDNFFSPLFSCAALGKTNHSRWCNPTFDELIQEALQTNDLNQRRVLYQRALLLLAEAQPLLPIAHSNTYALQHHYVQGQSLNPYGGQRFVTISKVLP